MYEREFSEFEKSGYKHTWSWVAFFWGIFWYFYKGLWAKALIMAAVCLLSFGMFALYVWIYCGVAGKYDLYLWQIKGKQLW